MCLRHISLAAPRQWSIRIVQRIRGLWAGLSTLHGRHAPPFILIPGYCPLVDARPLHAPLSRSHCSSTWPTSETMRPRVASPTHGLLGSRSGVCCELSLTSGPLADRG
eukprot:357922-Chlamydomonas_euryale.AAC.5